MPNTALADAGNLAERIRAAVETKEFRFDDYTYNVTVSIGVCSCACSYKKEISADALMQCADNLLYDAKRAGRNRVVVASSEIRHEDVDAHDY